MWYLLDWAREVQKQGGGKNKEEEWKATLADGTHDDMMI